MKKLEILDEWVELDVEGLGKGLCKMHESDPDMKAVLAFGMLDAGLCELMRKHLRAKVLSKFSDVVKELFPDKIEAYIKECAGAIEKDVYRHAKMIV